MKKMAVALTWMAVLGLALAQSARAQSFSSDVWQSSDVRPRELLALQHDLDQLDTSLGLLNSRQRPRFQPDVDQLQDEVLALCDDLNNGRVSRQRLDDLYGRTASLQTRVDRVQARHDAQQGYGQIPAGTEVHVQLDQMVSSRSAKLEERVEATVVESVVSNGRTVVPLGTAVSGYVAEVESTGRAQRDGRIRLAFDRLLFSNGTSADIQAQVVSVEENHVGGSTAKKAGLGALLGGVVGAIVKGGKGALIGAAVGAGGAIVGTKGQDIELPEGSQLLLRIDQDTPVARR